jgi:hypothetical protein
MATVGARLTRTATVVAVLVLAGWVALLALMVTSVPTDEVRWARLTWIFASVEAVAFGAAGALFGSTIQRERAERAEQAADENATGAANGRALAAALKADGQPDAQTREPLASMGFGGGQQVEVAAQLARRHAVLAQHLFPD